LLPLKTTRTALGLYGVLLVLPTLIFGWLYWRELKQDYEAQLAMVPEDAQDGARRILAGMEGKIDELLRSENERDFYQYADVYTPADAKGEGLALQDSPLAQGRVPRGVLGWFDYNVARLDGEVDLFVGNAPDAEERTATMRAGLESYRASKEDESMRERLRELDGMAPGLVPMKSAIVQRGYKEDLGCIRDCAFLMEGELLQISTSAFRLEFRLDENGEPRAIASRLVILVPMEGALPAEAECLRSLLMDGFSLRQGFVLDVDWLFDRLPRTIASQVLREDQELKEPSKERPLVNIGTKFAELQPVRDLGFSASSPEERLYGMLEVEINTDRMRERFESQSRKFLAVALMLVLTLGIDMTLLYRSVNVELEQAHRMQNFVAAVTHELRTPVSTIRLHGEMLLDGWAADQDKRHEYYRRIVRETDRLSTLVENVLEKSRLKENVREPRPSDLNELIAPLVPRLERLGARPDELSLELEEGLPAVWLIPESVAGILENLVENARKYALPTSNGEPILIRTRRGGKRVLLEVADRGPGVPDAERDRIFDAFYRLGSESTRTATGTGLGLHLVRLHAEAAGAEVAVRDREGGGTVFQVAFRPAK